MNLKHINYNCPVWEVSDFYLPDVELQEGTYYDQKYTSETTHLRKNYLLRENLCEKWDINTKELQHFIRTEMNDVEEVRAMWMNTLSGFKYPAFKNSGEVLEDGPGFDMAPHIDNRGVFGVLLINLIDNPVGSGTHFVDINYNGPVKKHTGVFMLNNWNTRHSIKNPGPDRRLVGYQNLHIDSIK
jgi:hypothetical protein